MRGLPPELLDLLARVFALKQARTKLEESRLEVIAEKSRLETKAGLLTGFSGKVRRERAESIKVAVDDKSYYDAQIAKIESLVSLLNKEISRWLDCCLKTLDAAYSEGLAAHDHAEDWARLAHNFDRLVKALQMDLRDLMALYKHEAAQGPRSAKYVSAVRKLLPVARQVEIDIEFLNNVLAQRARRGGAGSPAPAQHPEYGWCETIEQLGGQTVQAAVETLRELVTLSTGFLPALVQEIKREQAVADEKAALARGKVHPSFLKLRWESLKPATAQELTSRQPVAVITETEALLLDGEFTTRFNHYLIKSIVRSPDAVTPQAAAGAGSAVQNDAELKILKETLELELEGVAKLKANLNRRERVLRENEQAFEEKRQREQAALDEARAKAAAQEEEIARKTFELEQRYLAEQKHLEALIAENNARVAFIEESEQRLLAKGQEQIERLAELDQQEDEIMAAKRQLNEMRKEMGLPIVPLRTKPVDEFAE